MIKKEVILWIKDVRLFLFKIPKHKVDRKAWITICGIWITSLTAIIIAIIRR